MAKELPVEEEGGSGIPPWMLTYSDTVTLMLTFFIMLMTFSTGMEESYQLPGVGLLKGHRDPGMLPSPPNESNLAGDQRRLAAGRLGVNGAEKPPINSESALDQLKLYYPDLDISSLKELQGALVIRVPLVELFGTDVELTSDGKKVLDYVAKMACGQAYSVIVRVRAGPAVPSEERAARSSVLALRVVQYLRRRAGKACEDIGLSDNVDLAQPPLADDQCEVIMLEV